MPLENVLTRKRFVRTHSLYVEGDLERTELAIKKSVSHPPHIEPGFY